MRLLLLALAALSLPFAASARVPDDEADPRKIMEEVEGRAKGDRSRAQMTMILTDGGGRERRRVVRSASMLFKGGQRQLMSFDSPLDIKGTGLLTIDHDDGDKDDDQWLYLPSLHKSTRISSGEKSGAFMGSDFTYADMTRADPAQYEYTLLSGEVVEEGETCWLIEARPKTARAKKETGYLKSHIWVSKAKRLPYQMKMWVKRGKKLKYVTLRDFKQVGGLWVAHTLTARTLKGERVQSTTVLRFDQLSYDNADVDEALFSQAALEKGL
ncbi:outer membrane lipoprotein-sorting protein [Myxococcota bacterium]|nr:outer membrane lipoprotein-sorting protein [Myxococcota bacterium]MBU1429393.1 outer membrane lipoprotein-sorting protein [Myxococcota bacterium]MBU1896889.1 outer membrane lipoprotein-sorting protein [Myxococcota bacterium]